MTPPNPEWHPLERGFQSFAEHVLEQPGMAAELATSRAEYFAGQDPRDLGSSSPEELILADRRHLEWFLFEHASEALGDLPSQVAGDSWRERVGPEEARWGESLFHSWTGMFRVTSVEPGSGLWLDDLAGHGSYPVAEPSASNDIQVGDLLIGRIHPLGDTQFHLSPAVSIFRDERLVEALQADLERLRGSRRGTLRISQGELERMFFAAPRESHSGSIGWNSAPAAAEQPGEVEDRLRAQLGGPESLPPEEIDAWLDAFAKTVSASGGNRGPAGELISALMERAAFDTSVDLAELRSELHLLWSARLARPESEAEKKASAQTESPAASKQLSWFRSAAQRAKEAREGNSVFEANTGVERSRVEQALADFDQAREAGGDLELLFKTLEAELGIESEEVDSDERTLATPGVIGALVEEYLWELGTQDADQAELQRGLLQQLAENQQDLCAVEELETTALLEVVLEPVRPSGAAEEKSTSGGLRTARAFAAWIEEHHDHPLWTSFQAVHDELESSLPRLALASAALAEVEAGPREEWRELFEQLSDGRFGVLDEAGEFEPAILPEAARPHLRGGDWIRVSRSGEEWTVSAVRPAAYGHLAR